MTNYEKLCKFVGEHLQDDCPLDVDNGRCINEHNGYFVIYSDELMPSYWQPVGGWEDLTHQRYTTFQQAYEAARLLPAKK